MTQTGERWTTQEPLNVRKGGINPAKPRVPSRAVMLKRAAIVIASLAAATGVAIATSRPADSAPSALSAARSGILVGFYDDEQVYGRTDWAFRQLKSMRAGIVRITINWPTVAQRRPVLARQPGVPGVQLDGRRPGRLAGQS